MFKSLVTKSWFMLLLMSAIVSLLVVACGGSAGTDSSSSKNTVHMNDSNFIQSSITIKKGEKVTLVADTFTPHIISNGTWANATAKPAKESGAPNIKDEQVGGNSSSTIGPFTTTGTFHLYCTIHSGMNLDVIVQ
jgi:plastocyanin